MGISSLLVVLKQKLPVGLEEKFLLWLGDYNQFPTKLPPNPVILGWTSARRVSDCSSEEQTRQTGIFKFLFIFKFTESKIQSLGFPTL